MFGGVLFWGAHMPPCSSEATFRQTLTHDQRRHRDHDHTELLLCWKRWILTVNVFLQSYQQHSHTNAAPPAWCDHGATVCPIAALRIRLVRFVSCPPPWPLLCLSSIAFTCSPVSSPRSCSSMQLWCWDPPTHLSLPPHPPPHLCHCA